jgi:hypothetical protein
MHDAPVPPSPPKYSYLHKKNAKRVEQLQYVTEWMAFVLGMWTAQDPEFLDEDFAALWGLTRWLCGLRLPKTVDDFWTGPPVLERKPTPQPQDGNGHNGQTAREEPTPPPTLTAGRGQRVAGSGHDWAPGPLLARRPLKIQPMNALRGTER